MNQSARAARAIAPAATTADLVLSKLEAPLVFVGLAAEPEAVPVPDEPAEPVPEEPLLADELEATGAGVPFENLISTIVDDSNQTVSLLPEGLTVNAEELMKTWEGSVMFTNWLKRLSSTPEAS